MKRFAFYALFLVCLVPGCGRTLDKDADPEEGGRALRTALDAWKKGEQPADLEQRNPAIVMNDDAWRTGERLQDYKVEGTSMSGRQVRARVQIKVQDKNGKTREQTATYIIDTTPRIVIVRDLFAS